MLDLKFIRENLEKVIENTGFKNESADIQKIIDLDKNRRDIINTVQELKSLRNSVSKEIATLKKQKLDADQQIKSMKEVSDKIKNLDDQQRTVEEELNSFLITVPNMLHESVPIGKTEADNKFIRSWGEPKTEGKFKDHIQIAKEKGILDFERGAKVSGSGFAYYTGKGARLERALLNFMLDTNTETRGYEEMMSPFIVNRASMTHTGQIPKLAEDMYHAEKDDLYLIPTAEVPMTNFHSGEFLKEEDLTIKYCGYSPCFRREAGSYGKDTRGFLRVHQFNKVELVKFAKPQESYQELDNLVGDVENLLQLLNLPYRVLLLASGDTSFGSAMTYDLEVWSPAEGKWLEVSSCTNFESFQARRANIRYKPDPKSKPEFVHTLNGSALATPRIMVAILENYLQEDGTVKIPEALVKYCGFESI